MLHIVIVNRDPGYKDQTDVFVFLDEYVFLCCKYGHFIMGLYEHWLAFGANLKWTFKETAVFDIIYYLCWFHFLASKVATYARPLGVTFESRG